MRATTKAKPAYRTSLKERVRTAMLICSIPFSEQHRWMPQNWKDAKKSEEISYFEKEEKRRRLYCFFREHHGPFTG
jgi:hypothetical protein